MNLVSSSLLKWYNINKRDLPWRNNTNPYFIWLSEIILQQTRVEQGLPYFLKFVAAYPTIEDLAKANEDDVLRLWQGLGYYSRARNMLRAAQIISHEYQNEFPKSFAELKKLPGVGDYTAAAIASFAFGIKKGVLDGNVYRFLSRYYGIHTPINSPLAKKQFQEMVDKLVPPKNSGEFNQAIMEFGALNCKPKNPFCDGCVLAHSCYSKKYNLQNKFPVKAKKTVKKTRYFYFVVFINYHAVAIEKRTLKDIWQGLYQFPVIESKTSLNPNELWEKLAEKFDFIASNLVLNISETVNHQLTHQTIKATFVELNLPKKIDGFMWVKFVDLFKLAFPQILVNYLYKRFNIPNAKK